MNKSKTTKKKKHYTRKIIVTQKKFDETNFVDDYKFMELITPKAAIKELLRILLPDEDIVVVRSITQRKIKFKDFRGIILDCECLLKNGKLVNIEIQKVNNDDMFKRVRYYQSVETVKSSKRNKDFKYKDIPTIITIVICDFNISKTLDEPIYEVKRIIRDENGEEEVDNGTREIYVNLKSKKILNEKLKVLFKLILDNDYTNEEILPELSKSKEKINRIEMGGKKMGLAQDFYNEGKYDGIEEGIEKGIEKGIEQGIQQGAVTILVSLINDKAITLKYAADKLGMTQKELKKLMASKKYAMSK